MVDFQSRDTRRGPTTDDESETGSDAASSETDDTEAADAGDATGADGPETDGSAAVEEAADAGDATGADGPETDGDAADGSDPPTETSASTDAQTGADSDAGADDAAAGDPLAWDAETGGDSGETTDDGGHPLGAAGETDSQGHSEPLGEPAGADGETEAPVDPPAEPEERAGTETAERGRSATEPPASKSATPSRSVDVAVVTVAGDRPSLEDTVAGAFETAGHAVVRRERLRGGYDGVQQMVETLVGQEGVDVVVTVGGVGLSADALAIEAVHPLLEKALPGFGEAFRSLLADHIGTGIVGIRSTAGSSDGTLVFCLPGDADAAGLAVEEILATEAPILVDQLEG